MHLCNFNPFRTSITNTYTSVEESTKQENENVSTDQSDDTTPIKDPKPEHSPSNKNETVSMVTAEEGVVVSDEEDERPIDRRRQRKGGGASDSEEDSEGETPNEDKG